MDGSQGFQSVINFLILERLLEDHTHKVDGKSSGPAEIAKSDSTLALFPLIFMGQQFTAPQPSGSQAGTAGYEAWNPLATLLLLTLLRREGGI